MLRLFAAETDGDAILDLQISEMLPRNPLSRPVGTLAPVSKDCWRHGISIFD